ncbi:hypothetical protein DCC79_11825 [bacterium]|nr:MAG: hypothetical protein DCC79_11825 [bacterium]
MRREHQRDLVIILSSLLGVAAGRALRDMDRGVPPGPVGTSEAGRARSAGEEDAAPLVTAPALFAATTLSRRFGEQLALRTDNLAGHAALAFAVAAGLTYFADTLRRYIPGLGPGPSR